MSVYETVRKFILRKVEDVDIRDLEFPGYYHIARGDSCNKVTASLKEEIIYYERIVQLVAGMYMLDENSNWRAFPIFRAFPFPFAGDNVNITIINFFRVILSGILMALCGTSGAFLLSNYSLFVSSFVLLYVFRLLQRSLHFFGIV